ncbi:MAG: aminotransferase class III-fold pyridoxal phosphate-dependent enzyme [Clostridia bacterium]|nr:aminotransferase class III-fold pyridoxal phosphate-dependent enzyme [Clostridia bacterium]
MNHKKNEELYARACKSIPGAFMSNFKKEEGQQPIYVKSVKGARIYDFDDNEYIDFGLSYGPAILGRQNEHVQNAVIEEVKKYHTNEMTTIQFEAAEKIQKLIPSAELVRFTSSGTEANMNNLRVARAYTGKNMFVKFNGQYNGGADFIIGGVAKDAENPVAKNDVNYEDVYSIMCSTDGRAANALEDCYIIEWNDLDALENLFKKDADNIAAVIMEPVMTNVNGCMPEPGCLEGVRELCTKYKVVLIFDEVVTGFRMGLQGAQGYFGITPDLTTYAKAIGGGMPISVFCGKKEIMDVITKTDVLGVGTYNGHPVSVAALIATLEELEKNDGAVFKHIERLGNMLRDGMLEIADKVGCKTLRVQGYPGAWNILFSEKDKIINHKDGIENSDLMKVFALLGILKEKGIMTAFRFCTSAVHTEEDIKITLEKFEEALTEFMQMSSE